MAHQLSELLDPAGSTRPSGDGTILGRLEGATAAAGLMVEALAMYQQDLANIRWGPGAWGLGSPKRAVCERLVQARQYA